MTERAKHTFQFSAGLIAAAAGAEADYHESRLDHWKARADAALVIVKATAKVKIVDVPVTDGTEVDVVVDYGDQEAWREYQRARAKMATHLEAAERFRSDERLYATQGGRIYDLDGQDVHHYRLNDRERED